MPAVLVLIGCSVAVPQEALEAVLALQLADYLVQSLGVQRIIIHGESWVADTGQEGSIRVLRDRTVLELDAE